MTKILDFFRNLSLIKPLPAGFYHYQAPQDDPRNYRMHLRLEPDGSGILILNASTILHLNQTAAEYAYYLIRNLPLEQTAKKMAARYHVTLEQARLDYKKLSEQLQILINTPDLDPVTFLGFDRQIPNTGHLSAPYRLDCALTYRLPETSSPQDAPVERAKQELNTTQWKAIFDKAWNAGIPHLILTGGEPTLREDLPQLISHAEKNNQITGLLTDGIKLADAGYLQELLQTGLDHLMILLQPDQISCWNAIENALAEDIFVAVHLTISQRNVGEIPDLLQRLVNMGVKTVSLSAASPDSYSALDAARSQAASLSLDLVWDLPVPYSAFNPIALEVKDLKLPEGAGRAWMYVEPDGDVLPAQGENRVLGNVLLDSWEKIWKK